MADKRNIKLLIAFDGTNYSGWQRQKHDASIQEEIEKRLSVMTNSEVSLHGAGRTDAGVHAEGMTAHFHTRSPITCQAFLQGLNSMLPGAIRILSVDEVPLKFHSRFDARGKHYQYTLFTGRIMAPSRRLYTVHYPYRLNFDVIDACLKILEGTHDFSSFENSGSRDKSFPSRKGAVRNLRSATRVSEDGENHLFSFIGEGFLKNMVRNMMGTLLEAGRGQITAEQFKKALEAKDRTAGGHTAPPHGLTLKEVLY